MTCTRLQARVTHATIREYAKLAPKRGPCPVCFGSKITVEFGQSRFCDCAGMDPADILRLIGDGPVLQPLDICEDDSE